VKRLLSIFRCSHEKMTVPITLKNSRGISGQTYIRCLDCGKAFDYSWNEMRILGPSAEPEILTRCPVEAAKDMNWRLT